MPNKLEKYHVANEDQVFLEVEMGFGQPGKIKVFLGTNEAAEEWHSLKKRSIGKGKDLHQKTLVISTDVVDRLPATNWTSVTAKLSGGLGDKTISKKKEVGEGKPINYFYVVDFLKPE